MLTEVMEFLDELPERNFDDRVEFTQLTVPTFLKTLGYDVSNIYYQVSSYPIEVETGPFETANRAQQADAIVASSPHSRPWLVIETLFTPDKEADEYDARRPIAQEVAGFYLTAFDCDYYVELSDGHLFIAQRNGEDVFVKLEQLSQQDATTVVDLLSVPDELPWTQSLSVMDYSEISIDEPFFKLDVGKAVNVFEKAQNANEPRTRGEALEDLATLFFNGIPCLKVRGRKVRTRTGELDLVVEYLGHGDQTIFDSFDRFILVEAKNWAQSVGAKEVRTVKDKMNEAQVDLGVLFTRNGISGESGEDAVGVINKAFTEDGKIIIVISEKDILRTMSGESFYRILDEKVYQRKFSL